MELALRNVGLDYRVFEIYLLHVAGSTPPLFSQVIEELYWHLSEEMLCRNLDDAVERGEHELYGMEKKEFWEWFYLHDSPNNNFEPYLKMEDLVRMVEEYLLTSQLFFETYYSQFINVPLQEVW